MVGPQSPGKRRSSVPSGRLQDQTLVRTPQGRRLPFGGAVCALCATRARPPRPSCLGGHVARALRRDP
eukprot:4978192-Heterocapsa_arctica.AAC.1